MSALSLYFDVYRHHKSAEYTFLLAYKLLWSYATTFWAYLSNIFKGKPRHFCFDLFDAVIFAVDVIEAWKKLVQFLLFSNFFFSSPPLSIYPAQKRSKRHKNAVQIPKKCQKIFSCNIPTRLVLKQGSQTRIDRRATVQRKNSLQSAVWREKGLRGQTTRKSLIIR